MPARHPSAAAAEAEAAKAAPHSESGVRAEDDAASAARRPISNDDLLLFEWVADPRISPDGRRVAFTRVWVDREADAYRTRIMIVEADGSGARDLTSGSRDAQPRWSPDGTQLAFTRAEGEDPAQIWVLPMYGGEARRLTELKGGASEPAWSPDGKRIAFRSGFNPALDTEPAPKPKNAPARVVTRPVFRWDNDTFTDFDHMKHIWVVDSGGGTPNALTCGAFEEGPPTWSRDGLSVLFASDRRDEPWFGNDHSDLFAVPAALEQPTEGAALRPITSFTGPVGAFAEGPGGRFATIGFTQPEASRSYDRRDLLLAEGAWPIREVRNLSGHFDADIGEGISSDQHPPRGGGDTPLAFSADGRSIVTTVGRHGAAMMSRVNVEDGAVETLTDASHEVLNGTSTADGVRWALTLGDASTPLALYAFDAGTRKLTPLFDPNRRLLVERALGSVEEFWYPSFDGVKIQAWIVKPPDFDPSKKYPLILEIHGGPHTAYGHSFYHEFHTLAAAGYVVLYTNPRGSTTYGQEFGNVIQYRYPGDDYHDLMAGVDALIARGYIDEKRLGVTGGSGGGLLTNWAIAQTDRFKAAVTQRCVADWISMWYSSDFALFNEAWFRRPPYEDPQEYLERSPATLAARINTPLMVIHSEDDWRTPIGQGEAMFRTLKHQRKPAVMVRFPGEGHELSRSGAPSRRIQRLDHIHKWFDKYLRGKSVPDYDR